MLDSWLLTTIFIGNLSDFIFENLLVKKLQSQPNDVNHYKPYHYFLTQTYHMV